MELETKRFEIFRTFELNGARGKKAVVDIGTPDFSILDGVRLPFTLTFDEVFISRVMMTNLKPEDLMKLVEMEIKLKLAEFSQKMCKSCIEKEIQSKVG